MYLSQGNATVPFKHIGSFLRVFFLAPANLVLKKVACRFCVEVSSVEDECSLDLPEVVSIMRQYPLLNIQWKGSPIPASVYTAV
jgi:hypothetical protein